MSSRQRRDERLFLWYQDSIGTTAPGPDPDIPTFNFLWENGDKMLWENADNLVQETA